MNNIVLNISINKSGEHSVLVIVQRYVAQLHNRHNTHSIISALLRDLNSWKRRRNNMSGKINTLKIVLNRIIRLQDYEIKKREIQFPILKSSNHINLGQTKGKVLNRIERLQDYGIKKREIQYPILKSNNQFNLVQTKGAKL